jgi:hypothetical protein
VRCWVCRFEAAGVRLCAARPLKMTLTAMSMEGVGLRHSRASCQPVLPPAWLHRHPGITGPCLRPAPPPLHPRPSTPPPPPPPQVAQLDLTDAPRLDALVAHLMAPEVQRSWVDGGDGGGPSKGGSSSTLGAADISLEEGSGVGSESGGAGSDGAGGGEDAQRSGRAGGHATTPGAVAGVAGTLQGGEQADEVAPAAAGAPLPRSKAVGFGGPGRGRGRAS